MIEKDLKADFEQAIRSNGFTVDDFELTEKRDLPSDSEIYAITETVAIKRKSNGVEKWYLAGHWSTWPADFSDDLKKGVFG